MWAARVCKTLLRIRHMARLGRYSFYKKTYWQEAVRWFKYHMFVVENCHRFHQWSKVQKVQNLVRFLLIKDESSTDPFSYLITDTGSTCTSNQSPIAHGNTFTCAYDLGSTRGCLSMKDVRTLPTPMGHRPSDLGLYRKY
jgi:hypothetical protein